MRQCHASSPRSSGHYQDLGISSLTLHYSACKCILSVMWLRCSASSVTKTPRRVSCSCVVSTRVNCVTTTFQPSKILVLAASPVPAVLPRQPLLGSLLAETSPGTQFEAESWAPTGRFIRQILPPARGGHTHRRTAQAGEESAVKSPVHKDFIP